MLETLISILRYVPFLDRLIRSRSCSILRLPKELLSLIVYNLSLPSKACFALTCKSLFEGFGAILEHKNLVFPHPEIDFDGRRRFVPSSREREQLLLRLQGRWQGRWFSYRYCAGCLKLHPSHEFDDYWQYRAPEEISCTQHGIVALCHHTHLNARAKIRMIQQLEKGVLENSWNWHECTLSDPAGVAVDITIGFAITEIGQLLVHTRYVITPGARAIADRKPWRLMICPHRNLYAYLRQPGPDHAKYDCSLCQTSLQVDIHDGQSEVTVTRNLGGKNHPVSRAWQNQREINYIYLHR